MFSYQQVIDQMGGNKFAVMVGVKHITYSEKEQTVDFRFAAKAKNGANHVQIRLDADDTYTMIFYKIGRIKFSQVGEEISGLYCDGLQEVFTNKTGLYTSLGTMGRH